MEKSQQGSYRLASKSIIGVVYTIWKGFELFLIVDLTEQESNR